MNHSTSPRTSGEQTGTGRPTPIDLVTQVAFDAVDAFRLPDAAAEQVIGGLINAAEGDHAADAHWTARVRAETAHCDALEAGESPEQAEAEYRRVIDTAPIDTATFVKKLRNVAALLAMAHAGRHNGRRRIAATRTPAPAPRRTPKRGRSARLATNTRTGGSRRTTSSSSAGGGGSDGESDLPDEPEPPPAGSLPNDSLGKPRKCVGCGSPLDPDRNADATLCPPPKKSACHRLSKKGGPAKPRTVVEATPPAADFEPQPGGFAYGLTQCRAVGRHPEHPTAVARKVRALLEAGDREEARQLQLEWIVRHEVDPLTGAVVCRNCGRRVRSWKRDGGGLLTIDGRPIDLRFEMVTTADGQALNYKPRATKTFARDGLSGGGRSARDWHLFGGRADG